jgi:ribosomal protein L7/L12
MTQEEKVNIVKLLRKETGCGMMDASLAIDELIKALKMKTSHVIMDSPQKIKITFE